ncbi:anaerobic carbon-monoxide dehydrogenase catalytic subunit [Ruminiclostridium josui]|uniref:anaerobic carbon-monoxide dehydrogenase catalytic subunit n=1 Tax=Ruminiclostridium josui TaxID=1499 RepID=UPI00046467F8|nr:anaerobic carbon-monoxide dehydrogenase catalytic subunit [Ruminiclostridium josui]
MDFRYHHIKFDHSENHHHNDSGCNDYATAVAEYRRSFASKKDVLQETPDPAVKAMLLHMEEKGIDTVFDRFDAQKPQCSFGLAGVCCRICNMGPCKITKKSPKGVCGADADVIVARNILRSVAAGAAEHGGRGRESMLALKYASEGIANIPIEGESKVLATAKAFGLDTENKSIKELAGLIADILLEDLSRTVPGPHRTLNAFASKERIKVWSELDILPISPYHEVFESLNRTGTGNDSDWYNIMKQMMRTGIAFAWSCVLGSSIAMDSLFGLPVRSTSKVNIGALEKGYVNIGIHGHSPILVSEIVKLGNSDEFQELARKNGALGIKFYGICCSGLSAMYRYGGVIPLSNAIGAELVLGTGALDLWVADVQDIFPSIMEVAKCFKTTVVTTNDSARLPGAEHYGFDHHHSNMNQTTELATKILNRAIESFTQRREIPVYIPPYEIEAEVGFSVEYINKHFGSVKPIAEALKSGEILGIVNLVGCNNPRIVYEKAIVELTDILLENNVLVLTNGCASFPLMKLGYCSTAALKRTGDKLKGFLKDLPPVWHMGECLDNARASALFKAVAEASDIYIKDMPYAFASPEWSNEKGICAALSFRLLGIDSYHCVYAPTQGSDNVTEFMSNGFKDILGSRMIVNVNHTELANEIVNNLKEQRKALGWD